MRILETLHLRMAGEDLDDLEELVMKVTGPHGEFPPVEVFRHSAVKGDLLIHLRRDGSNQAEEPGETRTDQSGKPWTDQSGKPWTGQPVEPRTDRPSELGLRLAALLRFHGIVEHSVWVQGRKPKR
jgi:hypothetical protein